MNTPPRIYLLSNGFQPEYEIGFANGMQALWPEVVLVASDNTLRNRALPGLQVQNWRGSQQEGRSAWAKACNLLAYWRRVASAMRQDRDAIFHFNGLLAFRHPLLNLLEALSIRLLCRHWWMSVHNIVPHDRDTPLRRLVNRMIYALPDRLVVHTPRMQAELTRDWGVHSERVVCVRHGVDRPIEADAAEVARAQTRLGIQTQGRPLLLCFGNIAPYKGADLMLQALPLAHCHDKIAVLILGRMRDQAFFQQLQALAADLPAKALVQVIDAYVADDDVPGVMGGASAMVLPYRHIDQSGVLFTARAAGLPVISTPVGSMAEELIEGVDQLAPGSTPAGLAGALDEWFQRRVQQSDINQSTRLRHIEGLLWKQTLLPYRDAVHHYLKLDAKP